MVIDVTGWPVRPWLTRTALVNSLLSTSLESNGMWLQNKGEATGQRTTKNDVTCKKLPTRWVSSDRFVFALTRTGSDVTRTRKARPVLLRQGSVRERSLAAGTSRTCSCVCARASRPARYRVPTLGSRASVWGTNGHVCWRGINSAARAPQQDSSSQARWISDVRRSWRSALLGSSSSSAVWNMVRCDTMCYMTRWPKTTHVYLCVWAYLLNKKPQSVPAAPTAQCDRFGVVRVILGL